MYVYADCGSLVLLACAGFCLRTWRSCLQVQIQVYEYAFAREQRPRWESPAPPAPPAPPWDQLATPVLFLPAGCQQRRCPAASALGRLASAMPLNQPTPVQVCARKLVLSHLSTTLDDALRRLHLTNQSRCLRRMVRLLVDSSRSTTSAAYLSMGRRRW
jgi:hypothetical protein